MENLLKHTVKLLQATADENRLRILKCLEVRPACVCELVQATGLPQPRISRHLKILREAGLVEDNRDAQWVEYSLADTEPGSPEAKILHLVMRHLERDPVVTGDRKGIAAASRAQCDT